MPNTIQLILAVLDVCFHRIYVIYEEKLIAFFKLDSNVNFQRIFSF